ncbi:MAG: RNA polymerase sigma factor [Propionibacteriaceae bacterium]
MTEDVLGEVWRREAPHVLGALVRRYGHFDDCEDAVQEALAAALVQWERGGVPDQPRAWLVRVAARRLIDGWRSREARRAREVADAVRDGLDLVSAAGGIDAAPVPGEAADDTVTLLALCCHPALTPESRVALTLRAVGGLTTQQIAAAFLVPTATMAQRISRAKSTLRKADARFSELDPDTAAARFEDVREVLYLIFNEGYTASGGDRLVDVALAGEGIRLTRELCRLRPDDETSGLLALMLITAARTPARMDERGDLVPLAAQDRSRWNTAQIEEGQALVREILPRGEVGPHQLRAAIAAVHADARTWAETDWLQITVLYRMLDRIASHPMVTLNLAVAVGEAHGPEAGLAVVDQLSEDPILRAHHRRHAVRAHLLEAAGRVAEARAEYLDAARLTTSVPEQRYLNRRLEALSPQRSED